MYLWLIRNRDRKKLESRCLYRVTALLRYMGEKKGIMQRCREGGRVS